MKVREASLIHIIVPGYLKVFTNHSKSLESFAFLSICVSHFVRCASSLVFKGGKRDSVVRRSVKGGTLV